MFKLKSDFKPTGDQPQAIDQLVAGIRAGLPHQTLLGVTGSGKTFTIANLIQQINRPTLVISHNKTLAAQLYQEYRDFFPQNAVGYFVSYYDYYQPEAYIPQTDTYIEKETDVNQLIDKLRLQATTRLMTRQDVIIVASVSCIYNLGTPTEYQRNILSLNIHDPIGRRELISRLTDLQYLRSQLDFTRGTFRVRGNILDIWPAYEDHALRITLTDNQVKSLTWIDPVSSQLLPTTKPTTHRSPLTPTTIFPAKHYLTNPEQYQPVFTRIRRDLKVRVRELKKAGHLLEAHRLAQRVEYDLEMLKEISYVSGIENYSRYFDGRRPGEPPSTLLDYFRACDPGFLTIIDESHLTIPQIRGMYRGDRTRKQTLIDYGFRLPAALDNRPLRLSEFLERVPQVIYTSATPGEWEVERSKKVVEQLIRPTGLVDPEIEIRPTEGQIPNLVIEILKRKQKGERVLVTTLTKRTAEALTEYLNDPKKINQIIKQFQQDPQLPITNYQLPIVSYLHADIKTLDRQDILDELRKGAVDVLVGINLLREGLDLPEVSLVAILDADQEGFLRSKTSLIQTMGRASRHVEGKIILYAHQITRSMEEAINEVDRRRQVQIDYNLKHNISPQSIKKKIRDKLIERPKELPSPVDLPPSVAQRYNVQTLADLEIQSLTPRDKKILVRHLTRQMLKAADKLDFELAARLRDQVTIIKQG